MAKLPALVTVLAEVDGRDRATVDHYARTIREAGYIPTTKRGSGAAEMTAREAANLLIALCGADAPKEAPLAIDRFRSLRRFCVWSDEEALAPALPPLAEANTFGDALEYLIDDGVIELGVMVGIYSLAHGARGGKALADGMIRALRPGGVFIPAGLRITFHRYAADIAFWTPSPQMGEPLDYSRPERRAGLYRTEWEALFRPDEDRAFAGFYGGGASDRQVAVTVGLPTLFALHEALNPNTDTPDTEIAGDDRELIAAFEKATAAIRRATPGASVPEKEPD
jgi:hypothetical protein